MIVKVNGKDIVLFHGATLKHALLKCDEQLYHAVVRGAAKIYDEDGHETDIHGSVHEGGNYEVRLTEK